MERSRRTESTCGIGLPTAVTADECGIFLESVDFCGFSGFGQFAEMHLMVIRVGAKVINVWQSIAHDEYVLWLFAASSSRERGS
jgi:hypothetical protein